MIQTITANHRVRLLQAEIEEARNVIARMTGISTERQELMFFEAAFEWLEVITGNDATAMEQMPRLREFWGFWKKTWHRADIAFINHVRTYEIDCNLLAYYKIMHRTTLDNRHLHGTSVECDYHLLMKQLSNFR